MEVPWGRAEAELPPQLTRQQLRLIETAKPLPRRMQRHTDHPAGGHTFDGHSLGHELREGRGEAAPALVLETMDGRLDRTFISNRGSQSRQ
jgi:hypothetical protein